MAYAFIESAVPAKETVMEARRESQSHRQRFKVLPGRKRGRNRRAATEVPANIVCLYGVIVQRVSIPGLELVEFEFLPDAA
jgi:hypothetical protein